MTATIDKPTTYADAIRSLAEKHGKVTPQIVVKAARAKSSPLNPFFVWDDTAAAMKYRLIQAQGLIRSIRVTYEPSEDITTHIRVREFVSVSPESSNPEKANASVYIPYKDAIRVSSYREQVMSQCRRDAESFRQKYRALQEAAAIIEAMDGFILTTEEQA